MKSLTLVFIAALLPLAALPLLRVTTAATAADPVSRPVGITGTTFHNPLKKEGADPCLQFSNGWYYLSTTTAADIRIRRARRLGDLRDAPDTVVWKDEHPERFRDMWAAEFHRLNGPSGPRWYLYYTASDGKEGDTHHRMYVLESAGDDPLGPYTFKAKLKTDPDDSQYAIDGTVLASQGRVQYFVWCGRPSATGQGLYISRMTDPWTLSGPRMSLPADGFGCPVVREAPALLQHGGSVFLIYSACSADTADYKLGLLRADVGADLTNPASWKQNPKPVFARVDQYGVFGPGHCFFFQSPDGKQDWIAYHAKSGTANSYADRSTRAQPFTWNADGTPNFGLPLPVEQEIPSPTGER